MSNTKPSSTPRTFDRRGQLFAYPAATVSLIPDHKPKATRTLANRKTISLGKVPRHGKWQKMKYDSRKVRDDALEDGTNVGVRMRPTQMIVDIDPRNGGDEGWLHLCSDLGIDEDRYPTVITGSGGRHLYMEIPDMPVRDTLEADNYKGVEMKSVGRQCIAAGSIHPTTGKPYLWDESKPHLNDGWPKAPPSLVKMIRRPARSMLQTGGQYTPDQIAKILASIDPEKVRDQATWFKIMQACHHGSNGEARYEFIAWSVTDEQFANDADIIGRRWDSLDPNRNDGVTFRSLRMFAKKYGDVATIPQDIRAADDFPDDDDDMSFESDVDVDDIDDATNDDAWLDGVGVIDPMEYNLLNLNGMLDHAEEALQYGAAPLYQMAGRLVHPVRSRTTDDDDEPIRRAPNALTVRDVGVLRLSQYMNDAVPFYEIKTPPNNATPVRRAKAPPEKLAEHLLARRDKWSFPHLTGIIETPTLRPDGSLLSVDGYDRESGLLLDMGGTAFPAVLDGPTREDAYKALQLLKKPLTGFPFVLDGDGAGKSASRSVMLSGLLTATVRRSLPAAPMHGFSAPMPGTGKTKAVNIISTVATGHPVTAMSQGGDANEDEKRLFSVLLQGDQVVLLDNVTRPIGGNALCTILTEATWQSRVLGVSQNGTVATNALMTASGNNLVFEGDMTRRALLCRMDAGVENPEGRSFEMNLDEWVPAHRGDLVAACLTILRAYVVAGRPGVEQLSPYGSFEQWSRLVRGALVWLGEADPCLTRKYIAADDPVKAEFGEFVRVAHDVMGEEWFTAGELLASSTSGDDDFGESGLYDIIKSAIPNADKARLGRYLKSHENQIVDGLRLRGRLDGHRKVNAYQITPI